MMYNKEMISFASEGKEVMFKGFVEDTVTRRIDFFKKIFYYKVNDIFFKIETESDSITVETVTYESINESVISEIEKKESIVCFIKEIESDGTSNREYHMYEFHTGNDENDFYFGHNSYDDINKKITIHFDNQDIV